MSVHSTVSNTTDSWSQYAKHYDPIKIGSIDGTDTEPHDRGIIRALNSEYRANRHVKGRSECTIFVARLSPKTTKDTIKEVFSKYGRLRRFRMVKDIVTGLPKGYAFVEYETERAAEEAYRKANKMHIDGQAIFVDFECERLLKGWKPRRLGGGFGGCKESGQLRFGGRDRPFRKPINLEMQERQQLTRERKNRDQHTEEHGHRNLHDREEQRERSREKHPKYSQERAVREHRHRLPEYKEDSHTADHSKELDKNNFEENKDTINMTDHLETTNGTDL